MRRCNNYTIMRLAAAWLAMLGCQPANPSLEYLQIGLAEQESSPILAIQLHNAGTTAVTVDGCDVQVLSTYIFQVDQSTAPWPEKFEHHVELRDTPQGRTIAAGDAGVIPIAFVWDLPGEAPELVAVCKALLSVRYNASFVVEAEPVMFLVASSEDALHRALSVPLENMTDPAGVAEQLDSFQGKKSAGVQQVIILLRELAE